MLPTRHDRVELDDPRLVQRFSHPDFVFVFALLGASPLRRSFS